MSLPLGAEASRGHTRAFLACRASLVGAAYRVLGSLADAEDVVQEAWLRWSEVELATVDSTRAYLLTITTRLALNRLREQTRRREDYPGPWLPEPVTTAAADDPERAAETADAVSMAMLVVLSRLSPLERAAFVLHEVFDLPYADLAATLERSEPAVRQLVSRARAHVHASVPRQPADPATHTAVTRSFLAATATGSFETLVELMAPDIVLTSDGGGLRKAALRPVEGRDKVLRFLHGVLQTTPGVPELALVTLNGQAAIAVSFDGVLDSVAIVALDGGVVTEVFYVRNPDKLHAVVLGSGAGDG